MLLQEFGLLDLEQVYLEIIQEEFALQAEDWFELYDGRGVFCPALVLWLTLVQAMNKESMSAAIVRLQEGIADKVLGCNKRNQKAQNNELSSNTGAFSKGKKRLEVDQVRDFLEILNKRVLRKQKATTSDGREIALIDGSTIILEKTKNLEKFFPPQTHEHGKVHHPAIRIVFVSHGEDGVILEFEYGASAGSKASSEQGLSKGIIAQVKEGTLLLGDQNFGIFSIASRIVKTNKCMLLRLTESRARKFFRDERPVGDIDKSVTWNQSPEDKLLCPGDPITVSGRFIRYTLHEDGFRPKVLYFFTTSDLSVEELIKIYGKRVDIETDIRYLKHTFNLERINSKSKDGVDKEILIRIAAHNLLRNVVAVSARFLNLKPRELSFLGVARYALVFGRKIAQAKTEQEQMLLLNRFLKIVRQQKHPNRSKKRHEPRKVTKKQQKYPIIKVSRNAEQKKLRKSL